MKALRWLGFALACLIAVGIAVAGLVYANVTALTVRASSAQLVTEQYSLGTPYAGIVQDLRVARGDAVSAGDELFRIQSPTLEQAMQTQTFTDAGVGYAVEDGGILVFTAAQDGVVQQVDAEIGSFVEEDETVVVVAIDDSIHLEAHVSLNARDYARVPVDGTISVSMPDGSTVEAAIYDVEVDEFENGRAATIVRARSDEITTQSYMVVGAPVEAELHLRDEEGFGGWLVDQLGRLFTPGGFDR